MGVVRNAELKFFSRLGRTAPSGLLGRLAFWLLFITLVATLGRLLPGLAGLAFYALSFLSASALLFVLIPLLWRYTMGRFLWKVRNRLILTYLLMGFTPVALFVALAFVATYIFLGQFAIFAASAELDRALQQQDAQNHAFVLQMSHILESNEFDEITQIENRQGKPPVPQNLSSRLTPDRRTEAEKAALLSFSMFLDGKLLKSYGGNDAEVAAISSLPAWAPEHFSGIAIVQERLFLRVLDTAHVNNHTVVAISSTPIVKTSVDSLAEGLGRITIVPDISFRRPGDSDDPAPISTEAQEKRANAVRPNTIIGGTLPRGRHLYDLPVNFYAPLRTTEWQTGRRIESGVTVASRPTLLYDRLFGTSLQVGAYVQDVLIGLALFFGLLELIAFLMAMRLNQTITRSVSDLYGATLAIDSGDFAHRITVTRKDQLAALSQSFNIMCISLERLLVEQREKERLQGELEIAQQVQANLFPSGHVSLPTLEVHGVCQPARTVSGDYYDFLVAGSSELSLALGDISGKGISAALLMATLHSAVRAYRFAGDDMRAAETVKARRTSSGGGLATLLDEETPLLAASFAEPAQILGLLNRHLYRSTQPEKYATLFLAHYDGRTSELIYSTGGQLPPLLLRVDDTVERLDCGGTVIGLMDNMQYEQGTETMRTGDILIAYSDGVTEPENEFGDFGEDRLLEVVRRHRRLPLDQIADQVMQALRSWIGTAEQPDDITLVLARQRERS